MSKFFHFYKVVIRSILVIGTTLPKFQTLAKGFFLSNFKWVAENNISGISKQRNPILHSLSKYLLPYKGYGTGIKRALGLYSDFDNDIEKEQFTVTIKRNYLI